MFEKIKIKFKKLEKLDLSSNLIPKKKNNLLILQLESSIKEFKI